jgi:hypothetical protein
MLSKELFEELRQIIKEDYGVELSPKALQSVANFLTLYFKTLQKVNSDL